VLRVLPARACEASGINKPAGRIAVAAPNTREGMRSARDAAGDPAARVPVASPCARARWEAWSRPSRAGGTAFGCDDVREWFR